MWISVPFLNVELRKKNFISVNHGHGLNITSGIFTAPITGTYAFHFHALTRDGTATYIKFMHNGRNVGGAYRRHEGEADEDHESLGGSKVSLQM